MTDESTPQFRGYKAEALHYLFFARYDRDHPQERIDISTEEVRRYLERQGKAPGNIYNFFKDIVRNGKMPRDLSHIAQLGYSIVQIDGGGAFVRSNNSELVDVIDISRYSVIEDVLDSNLIPPLVWELIRTDEGAVISIVEYCRVLEQIMGVQQIFRVQAPLKVQPNEVDGCYVFEQENSRVLLSVEAKSKGSDVLLMHQIYGAAQQALNNFGQFVDMVRPIGVKIQPDNRLLVVVFAPYHDLQRAPAIERVYLFTFSKVPFQWMPRGSKKAQRPLL